MCSQRLEHIVDHRSDRRGRDVEEGRGRLVEETFGDLLAPQGAGDDHPRTQLADRVGHRSNRVEFVLAPPATLGVDEDQHTEVNGAGGVGRDENTRGLGIEQRPRVELGQVVQPSGDEAAGVDRAAVGKRQRVADRTGSAIGAVADAERGDVVLDPPDLGLGQVEELDTALEDLLEQGVDRLGLSVDREAGDPV